MRKSHFVCTVIVALLGCWTLSFAETAKEFNDKGEAAYKAKDYAKAVEYYTEVLKLEPTRHETIYARGVNYYKLKRYDDALADFDKVKSVKGIDHHALNYIGLIYMAKEDYPAAFNAFKAAVDLEPKSLLYCLNAARAAVKTDNRASALVYYKQAVGLDPKNKEATQYVAARRAAIAESEKKDQERQMAETAKSWAEYKFPTIAKPKEATLAELESVFRHCTDNKIPAEKGMDSLSQLCGVEYAKRNPGGGDRLNELFSPIADRPRELFKVEYDNKGRIHRYYVTRR
jgi:tetratricopeptide (TPR) repeat protein